MKTFLTLLMLSVSLISCGGLEKLAESALYPYKQVNKNHPPLPKGYSPFEEVDLNGTYAYVNRNPDAKFVLVYCHGNGESLASDVTLLKELVRVGMPFVAFDYPAYGHSTGKPSEATLSEAGRKVIEFVRHEMPDKMIVLWGRSMGAAVALQVYDDKIDSVILISPWTSFEDAAEAVSWLGKYIPQSFLVNNRYDSREAIKKVKSRTLIFHGTEDEIIPFSQGEELSFLNPAPTRFIPLTGAGHNDVYGRTELWSEFFIFLNE